MAAPTYIYIAAPPDYFAGGGVARPRTYSSPPRVVQLVVQSPCRDQLELAESLKNTGQRGGQISSRARHSSHRYPQNTQRFDLSASSRANKWSYIMTKVAAPRLYLSRGAILPAQILDRLSCRRSGGLGISCAEIKLFFAKVASISWGRCKVKNKGDGKPEKSQGPVLQRHIRSTSLRFPSDSKADD